MFHLKIKIVVIAIGFFTFQAAALKKSQGNGAKNHSEVINAENGHPKLRLVVGIIVDLMRYDYLFRFKDDFSAGGFNRLIREGFLFENANYNYVPTYTAPGHACVYTGSTPSVNGIIANDWYDRSLGKLINCVGDSTVKPV